MTPKSALGARFDGLDSRLRRAADAIAAADLDQTLRARMQNELHRRVCDCRDSLARKRDEVAAATISGDSWLSLTQLEAECAKLLQEALAFLQGGRARAAGIDNGLCAIADVLLDEIEQHCELGWHRFTILADSETFSDVVQLIRLRYPPGGVWDLPIAAHEYGHFALPRLTSAQPDGRRERRIADYVGERAQQSRHSTIARSHLQELFCDCFATFVLGPSYPLSCVLLRFDPTHAGDDTETHPAPAKRLAAMQTVLAVMNDQTGSSNGAFDGAIQILDGFWSATADRDSAVRAEAAVNQANIRADAEVFAYHMLQSIGGARYTGWGNARIVAAALSGEPCATPRRSIRDVLTAAWMLRLMDHTDPDKISRDAMAYCRAIQP